MCPFCENHLNSNSVCKVHGTIAQPEEVPEDLDEEEQEDEE